MKKLPTSIFLVLLFWSTFAFPFDENIQGLLLDDPNVQRQMEEPAMVKRHKRGSYSCSMSCGGCGICVMKKKQETPQEELLSGVNDPEYGKMMEKLQTLKYTDTPNYMWFHLQLKPIALRNRHLETQPFDWEPGGEGFDTTSEPTPKKSKKKKQKEKATGGEPSNVAATDEKKK